MNTSLDKKQADTPLQEETLYYVNHRSYKIEPLHGQQQEAGTPLPVTQFLQAAKWRCLKTFI